ncbi:microcin C ABC transporter permease YejB [Pseudomonadota bacterium]
MLAYTIRRLFLIVPTLLGILLLNFILVQFAPGGPIEQLTAQLSGADGGTTSGIGGSGDADIGAGDSAGIGGDLGSAGAGQGIDPELIKQLEAQFGFDKPLHERFFLMLVNFLSFDFGTSYFRDESVVGLIVEKLPVSISLGIWTTLIVYLISIPMGIRKAVRDGSSFDIWTSGIIIFGYAIPSFLFAVLLVVLFSGGNFLDWFPLRGLVSENWESLSWPARIVDYLWHMVLPVTALVVGGFATLTLLTKNSFLDQIKMQYVITAQAKGLSEQRVLYGHVFRNAMLIVIAGFPAAFVDILFTSALLIEIIFSLDGVGLLGFEAIIKRDYPVMFGTLYIFTLIGLVMNLVGDLAYTMVDPRIDFESRDG